MEWGTLTLDENDFRRARDFYKKQLMPVQDSPNLFRASLYCILSAAERQSKHEAIYDMLLGKKLDSPNAILGNPKKFKKAIRGIRFPNMKYERLMDFSDYYRTSDISERIIKDLKGDREREFEIRDEFARDAPGMGLKVASFVLIKMGYEKVVPVDVWIIRALKSAELVEMSNYSELRGPSAKQFLLCEETVVKLARDLGISPALLQFAIWKKAVG